MFQNFKTFRSARSEGFFAFILLVALGLSGCINVEIKPDELSGKDLERAGAKLLTLGKLTDDHLSSPEGDATDWKFFKVQTNGVLTLTVFWDEHKDVDAIIDIRDRFGALIASQRHSSEVEKDVINKRVEAGTHFIRMYASGGSSVYTIEAIFEDFEWAGGKGDRIPEEDRMLPGMDPTMDKIPPEGNLRPITSGSGRKDKAKRPNVKPAQYRPRPSGRPRPPARPVPAGAKVGAVIKRLVKGKRGRGSSLTINKGRKAGVQVGAKGYIIDDNGSVFSRFTVTQVGPNQSKAKCSKKPHEIGTFRMVKVQVQ